MVNFNQQNKFGCHQSFIQPAHNQNYILQKPFQEHNRTSYQFNSAYKHAGDYEAAMIKLKQLEKELKVKADAMGLRAAVNYTPLTGQASYSLSSKMRDRPFAFPRLVNRLGIPMSRLHEFKVSSTTKEAPILADPAA